VVRGKRAATRHVDAARAALVLALRRCCGRSRCRIGAMHFGAMHTSSIDGSQAAPSEAANNERIGR
jgi:hypothetical protein